MEKERSQKLGESPIAKLLFTMSAPAILSMLVQALYNVVDSIFIAHYSPTSGLTAISLAFPMQMATMAFALGIGIGAGSLISRRLGEGSVDDASLTAKNAMFLAMIMSLFFAVFGYFISKGFISLFVDKGSEVYSFSIQYLSICMVLSFGLFFEILASKILQATGNMIIPMVSQLIGAITNIILDPILIFGKLGFKPMGVRGAAIATVIGQVVAMIFVIIKLFKSHSELDLNMKKFKPQKNIWVK